MKKRNEIIKKTLKRVQGDKLGFTLAEVLITMTIIGIVAVLTVPHLVSNIQEREWATSSQVFLKNFEESLRVMNTQNVLADYSSTEEFVNELKKFSKITKVCTNDNLEGCFNKTFYTTEDKSEKVAISDLKTSSTFSDANWETNTVGLQFNNGVTALLSYNPTCNPNPYDNTANVMDCVALLYDTSGFARPNMITKDVRTTTNVQTSALGNICLAKLGGVCVTKTIFTPTPVTEEECVAMAQSGKYGDIKGCDGGDTNYWAGAVKACGGVDKLPSDEQLKNIIRSMYDCGENCEFPLVTVVNSERDFSKFSQISNLGGSNGSSSFVSSTNYGIHHYGVFVTPSYYQYTYIEVNNVRTKAICVGD